MRILVLATDAFGGRGGIAKYNRDLLHALASSRKVSYITAITRSSTYAFEEVPSKVNFVSGRLHNKGGFIGKVFLWFFRGPWDLLICAHLNLIPVAWLIQIFKPQLPIYIVIHGIEAWKPRWQFFTKRIVNNPRNRILSVSHFTFERFRNWSGAKLEKCTIVPNTVNLTEFRPGERSVELERKYGLKNKKVILSVARLDKAARDKGIYAVLRVLPDILKNFPDLYYLIAGDGDDIPSLKQEVSRIGLDHNVIFTGFIDESEKPDYYRLADAYVLPGKQEGFGITYIEAAACGIPVVASIADASKEAILGGELGLLADPNNPASIKDAVLKALQSEPQNNSEKVQVYSQTKFKERIEKVVNSAPAKHSATPLVLYRIFKIAQISIFSFIPSAVFAIIASFCEVLSLSLLIPLIESVSLGYYHPNENSFLGKFLLDYANIPITDQYRLFASLVGLVFLTSALKNLSLYFSLTSCSFQVRRLIDALRQKTFVRILSFGKLYFDRESAGRLHERLLGFTSLLAQRFTEIRSIFSSTFLLCAYLLILFYISWELALLTLVAFPLFYGIHKWLLVKIRRTSRDFAKRQEALGKKLTDIFSCIELVKMYSQEAQESRRFGALCSASRNYEFSIDKKVNFIGPLQETLTLFVIVILIFIMTLMEKTGTSAAAKYLVFFYALRRVATSFASLNTIRANLTSIEGPAEGIISFFDNKSECMNEEGTLEFSGRFKEINFRNLSFSYSPNVSVLRNVSFSIAAGRMTALVGTTGAGKTTLINILMKLYQVPSGSIFIDGKDILEFKSDSWRSHFAVVNQSAQLFNDTLRNNLIYGLNREVPDDEIYAILEKARLLDFVQGLPQRLETITGDRGVQLSGGEKQRLSIARALLKQAEILILDEATSSLDSQTEKMIQQALAEAAHDRTTIVIAHRLSTIKNSDKIVVLDHGEVVEQGEPEVLFKAKGKFHDLCQAQKFL